MWEDMKLMSVDETLSKKTMERIKTEAKYAYTGHDTVLDMMNDIHNESVHFNIRFANGNILPI